MFCSFYVYKFGLFNIGVYRVLLTFGVSLKATLGTAAFLLMCLHPLALLLSLDTNKKVPKMWSVGNEDVRNVY